MPARHRTSACPSPEHLYACRSSQHQQLRMWQLLHRDAFLAPCTGERFSTIVPQRNRKGITPLSKNKTLSGLRTCLRRLSQMGCVRANPPIAMQSGAKAARSQRVTTVCGQRRATWAYSHDGAMFFLCGAKAAWPQRVTRECG